MNNHVWASYPSTMLGVTCMLIDVRLPLTRIRTSLVVMAQDRDDFRMERAVFHATHLLSGVSETFTSICFACRMEPGPRLWSSWFSRLDLSTFVLIRFGMISRIYTLIRLFLRKIVRWPLGSAQSNQCASCLIRFPEVSQPSLPSQWLGSLAF
jgi:hypothetical protein